MLPEVDEEEEELEDMVVVGVRVGGWNGPLGWVWVWAWLVEGVVDVGGWGVRVIAAVVGAGRLDVFGVSWIVE